MVLQAGDILGGYRIDGLISSGGMGEVYRAVQLSVDRLVALKILHDDRTHTRAIERFKQEARVLARINHPGVVQILDLREDKGMFFIIMELIEGVDLAVRLREAGPLEESVAIDYLRQCALALAAAAEKGIVHRDIKPSNIMLTTEGILKITDFGVAKSAFDTGMTSAGALLGTPDYMPPEQIEGDDADTCSDIYALGASFYHLLAGRAPFQGKTFTDILVAHKTEKPKPLMDIVRVSPGLSRLLASCLEKRPEDRPQSARALAEACERLALTRAAADEESDPQALVRRDHVRELALIEYLARSHRLDRTRVEEALKFQREQPAEGATLSLEDILLDQGHLRREDLTQIEQDLDRLRRGNDNRLVMQLIRRNSLLTSEQMSELEPRVEDHGILLLTLLERKGWLSPRPLNELQKLVARHREHSFAHALGQVAVESGVLAKEDLDTLLARDDGKPLGVRMVESGKVSLEDLRALLDVQKLKAVDHFFSVDAIGVQLRLRDVTSCPHCKGEVFVDDDLCLHCKRPLRRTTSTGTMRTECVDDLEVIEDFPEMRFSWWIRTRNEDKGPYPFARLQTLACTGKLKERHQVRPEGGGDWRVAAQVRGLARQWGICFHCANFRPKEAGVCDVCGAVEP